MPNFIGTPHLLHSTVSSIVCCCESLRIGSLDTRSCDIADTTLHVCATCQLSSRGVLLLVHQLILCEDRTTRLTRATSR